MAQDDMGEGMLPLPTDFDIQYSLLDIRGVQKKIVASKDAFVFSNLARGCPPNAWRCAVGAFIEAFS